MHPVPRLAQDWRNQYGHNWSALVPVTLPHAASPYEVSVMLLLLMEAQPGRPIASASGSRLFEENIQTRETLHLVWGVRQLRCWLAEP